MTIWPFSPENPLKPSTTLPFRTMVPPMPSDIKMRSRSDASISFAAEQIALAAAAASLQRRTLTPWPRRSVSIDFRSTLRQPRKLEHWLFAEAVGDDLQPPALLDEQPFEPGSSFA